MSNTTIQVKDIIDDTVSTVEILQDGGPDDLWRWAGELGWRMFPLPFYVEEITDSD